jgi:hypothetical protein
MGRGRLPGRGGVRVASVLPGRPATPIEGETGGRGVRACTTPSLPLSTPGEGEAGRRGEGVRSGGGVDRLSCWVLTLLFPPPPRVGGRGAAAEEVPGCDLSLREERSAHHGG